MPVETVALILAAVSVAAIGLWLGPRPRDRNRAHLEAMNADFRTYSPRPVPPTDADELRGHGPWEGEAVSLRPSEKSEQAAKRPGCLMCGYSCPRTRSRRAAWGCGLR